MGLPSPGRLVSAGLDTVLERGIGPLANGIGAVGLAAGAAAGDLLRGRPDDPLEEWDADFIRITLPTLELMTRLYFRTDVRGLEHIPSEGPVLLVGNHSGGLLIADTVVFASAFYDHFGAERRFHQLAHDVVHMLPGLAPMRRYGMVSASHDVGERALDAGAAVLVYPGGDYETFRPSWQSSDVDFGGRSGFVRLALEKQVPIVPVVAIGGQETALFITRGQRLARLLGLNRLRIKVLPIALSPPFGLTLFDLPGRIPLPSQIKVQVLPPLDLRARDGADGAEEEVYGEVTRIMQQALDELAEERDLPILGSVRSDGGDRPPTRDGAPEKSEPRADRSPDRAPPAADAANDEPPRPAAEPATERTPAGEATAPADRGVDGATRAGGAENGASLVGEPTAAPATEDAALVGEFAEAGAEEGAGAELRVEEPWAGYDAMRVGEIADLLKDASSEAVAAVEIYERMHRGRKGVLSATERRLKELSNAPS